MSTYFVCPAPPCSNGRLHLGHLGGVYLLADIYARYLKLRGHTVRYVTGADEHGTYTLVKAMTLAQPVDETSEYYCKKIEHCLRVADVSCDDFIRTSSREHATLALEVYEKLRRGGYVSVENDDQLYCERCQEFAADSLAIGKCPVCGSTTDSSLCEECGEPIAHRTIVDAKHRPCGTPLARRSVKKAHLRLERVADTLRAEIARSAWSDGLKRRELGWLDTRLRNLPMTRNFPRGVLVEHSGEVRGQSLMTWFEGLWCFLTGVARAAAAAGGDPLAYLRAHDARVVFFMGQDNRFYYSVGVSAVLHALGAPIPHRLAIQSFYQLNGEKFSTSRDHALWTDDVVAKVGADGLRFHLFSIAAPFPNASNDVSWSKILDDVNWLRMADAELAKGPGPGDRDETDGEALRTLNEFGDAIEELRFWDANAALRRLGKRVVETGPSERSSHSVAVWLTMLRAVAPRMAQACGRRWFGEAWGADGLPWDLVVANPHLSSADRPLLDAARAPTDVRTISSPEC